MSAALIGSVAQALEWAIKDPLGQSSWNELISRNSRVLTAQKRLRGAEETRQAATVFDSSSVPRITIERYLLRLQAGFKCSDVTFIAALILVDRLLEFDGGRLPLTLWNVHRIFLASLVVAVKYHEDLVYSNKHYAKAGGVHLREVNRLERVLLLSLDYNLRIEPEQYRLYEETLQTLAMSTDPQSLFTGVLQKTVDTEALEVSADAAASTTSEGSPSSPSQELDEGDSEQTSELDVIEAGNFGFDAGVVEVLAVSEQQTAAFPPYVFHVGGQQVVQMHAGIPMMFQSGIPFTWNQEQASRNRGDHGRYRHRNQTWKVREIGH